MRPVDKSQTGIKNKGAPRKKSGALFRSASEKAGSAFFDDTDNIAPDKRPSAELRLELEVAGEFKDKHIAVRKQWRKSGGNRSVVKMQNKIIDPVYPSAGAVTLVLIKKRETAVL